MAYKVARIEELDRTSFRIRVKAFGEHFDLRKHTQGTEVKAITYHGLSVTHTPAGWMAEVIADI